MIKIQRSAVVGLLLILFLIESLCAAESKEIKRVLIVYSEDRDHPAHELTDRGIRETFRSNERFDIHLYTEYLDASRFSGPSHARAFAEYLHSKYSGFKMDAIVAVYPAAADMLLGEARSAFPSVPIIACAVNRSYAESLDRSPSRSFVTGVVMGDNIAGVLDSALRMRPETKRAALIAGTKSNDAYSEQIFRQGLKTYAPELEVIDLTKLPIEDILVRVGTLQPGSIILYSGIFRDGAGKSFVPREALSMISRAASVPVFSLYDSYLGFGIVGGSLVSLEKQGIEAARLALRILGGESPASLPFNGEQAYASLYDWREMKRWGIPESAVPPGSEIRYRERSFWEEHSRKITGVIVLIVVQTVLILGLLISIRKRRKAERSLLESEERVRLAVSSAGAGLWSLEKRTGHIWATDRTMQLL
ncbi:MAG: hypothetical protein QG577_2533, partial [Thermodesulfobacteriota bacterium]|nr:hypothetical protein [Thermodesulfobacteriota bacterium]